MHGVSVLVAQRVCMVKKRCNCSLTRIFVWLVSVVSVLGGGSAGAHGDGAITLIDMDDVCVTNTNRQIHALRDNVGLAKAEVMAERIRQINPNVV
ncbi:ThiF family adenylyltransferase [Shigella flexneri]